MSDNQYKKLSNERKKLQAQGLIPEWMNSAAWQIFKKSYAYKGEKGVRGRHETIAKTLAGHMPFHMRAEWEQKFFDILWKGWLSPASPVLSNTGTTRGMPVSCLTGDSLINVRNGGVKKIKDIISGDEVLTHQGRWKRVIAKQSRMSCDDLYELVVDTRQTPIHITGNHQVLTNRGWLRVDEIDSNIDFIATNGKLEYVQKPCTLKFDNSGLAFNGKVIKDVEVDEDLAWALGLWFAEGSLNRIDTTHGRTIRITMGVHEEEHVIRFGEIFKEKFGVNYNHYFSEHNGRKWVTCNVNSKVLANYFGDMFGTSCLTKTITTELMEMPLGNLEKFLDGFYDGDGRKSSGDKPLTPDIRIYNPNLLSQLYDISLKIGEKVSYSVDRSDGRNRKNQYSIITFHKMAIGEQRKRSDVFRGVMFQDGNRYCRFKLNKIETNEMVYDITVEDDHSFSVCGVVVHNCSGGVIGDTVDSFYTSLHEQAILSKNGFGCSGTFSDIRPRGSEVSTGGTASGAAPVIEDFATMASKINQGMRRGATASYLHIDHDDFDEVIDFIEKHPDGYNIGWIITDAFTERLRSDDEEAQRRYQRVLYCKMVTGKGYLFFIDKVNRARPQMYKDFGLLVKGSNLCNEIRLYADDGIQGEFDNPEGGHTFTCVLSSMNVAKYDEWKDTDAIFIATVFLDCVVSEFLERCHGINGMQKAYRFTKKSRPIGLGQLGIGTYFQMKGIPYESLEADYIDYDVQKQIYDDSLKASKWLAELLGEPEWCKGYGVRNSHRCANAPNKTSSQLMGGISESFSPDPAMVWVQSTTAGDVNRITPAFLEFLKSKNLYNDEIIESIIQRVGSCQHLEQLTDEEKLRFKTGFEMDQSILIRRASRRQKHIDQGQSLNIYVSADGDEDRINDFHCMMIDDEGIHGAYYVYSQSGVVISNECVACEG